MNRFLRNCTAVLLAVAALLWAGGALYRHTTAYKNLERTEETDKYDAMPDKISFAVFGSSHGRDAFQAADYGEGFFNFSMSSQTPQYDLMQLRQFGSRIQPGATIILTVSYMSPFWQDTQEQFEEKQERYYRILAPQNIVDCDFGHWVLDRWSPLLTTGADDVITALLHPAELRADTNAIYGHQVLMPDVLADETLRIHENHLPIMEKTMPDGNPVMLEAYRGILSLCEKNGWHAVLVTPPYADAYTECFPPEDLSRFRTLVSRLSEEGGVPWLDYSQDSRFSSDYTLFKNIDHLNLVGAKKFAQILRQQLP